MMLAQRRALLRREHERIVPWTSPASQASAAITLIDGRVSRPCSRRMR
jgi:hypothetical protein